MERYIYSVTLNQKLYRHSYFDPAEQNRVSTEYTVFNNKATLKESLGALRLILSRPNHQISSVFKVR